jgi:hypothetical protein
MRGGKNKHALGYTIVEVLIVLAVSGLMFVIAAVFISGKQARTAFTAGSNDFNASVQAVVSQVINGQYSDVDFVCKVNPSHTVINISDPSGGPGETQGTKADCVYIGKVMHFVSNSSSYTIYPMAASRIATSLNITAPLVNGAAVDLTKTAVISDSLQVKMARVVDSLGASHNFPSGIGFAQSVNADGSIAAQTIGLYYTTTVLGPGSMVALKPARSATICVTDGSRYAVVTLGDQTTFAGQLNARLKVVNAGDSACV